MLKKDIQDLPGAGQRATIGATHSLQVNVAGMPVAELLQLRAEINAALPASSLKDLDLASELVIQVLALQAAQARALGDDDTPTNQLAQAMGALTSALTSLVRLQNETYTSERIKKMEQIFVECAVGLPADTYTAFLIEYERRLKG